MSNSRRRFLKLGAQSVAGMTAAGFLAQPKESGAAENSAGPTRKVDVVVSGSSDGLLHRHPLGTVLAGFLAHGSSSFTTD